MKLELKHLAPYLPYGLKGRFIKHNDIVTELDAVHDVVSSLNNGNYEIKHFRPYLRPLSDLTKEIEHNGEKFVPSEKLAIHLFDEDIQEDLLTGRMNGIPFWVTQKYFEWHFDVFNLIEKGLAIEKELLTKTK